MRVKVCAVSFFMVIISIVGIVFAQENTLQAGSKEKVDVKAEVTKGEIKTEAPGEGPKTVAAEPVKVENLASLEKEPEDQTAIVDSLSRSQNVTLEFKDADIRNVLKIISYKSGVNIVVTPEVMGNVTIRLIDVPWEKALDAILKIYGFGYDKQGNIITVAPLEKLTSLKKQEVEFSQVQPTATEVFVLRYLDAYDAKKVLESQLSPRGRITLLETTGQAGWEFGAQEMGKRRRISEGRVSRSKTLLITDIPLVLDKIKVIIEQIDVKPQQIVIEAKLIEVNRSKLNELGFDWGTGTDGPTALRPTRQLVTVYSTGVDDLGNTVKVKYDDVLTLPQVNARKGGLSTLGMQNLPETVGFEFLFQKLTGTKIEAFIKALETTAEANVLSAPKILTLNNQEATILVGTKFPLIRATVSAETGSPTGQSLDRYQDIGIQLNVVPQIVGKDHINLIIHPAVSTYSQTVKALSSTGITLAEYPIIEIREAETQIMLRDDETIVMGGLLKDEKSTEIKGIPFLKDIPFLGALFSHKSTTVRKTDLLIFINSHIIKEGEYSAEEMEKLKDKIEPESNKAKTVTDKKG
jgi:type IV pilus assembly protein PilQ